MNLFSSRPGDRQQVQLLLRWRWLVLFIAVPISLVIEVMEGYSIDLHLLDEIIIDGLFLPITTWVVLTFAARRIRAQTEREELLELRQRLMQHLTEHRDFDDLAHFLVHFPATLLPVDHAALFVYDHEHARLDFVTEWTASGATAPTPPYERPLTICSACQSGSSEGLQHTGPCIFEREQLADDTGHWHYLALYHEKRIIGVLHLRYEQKALPQILKAHFINTLLPELGQALARSITEAQEAERLYREAQIRERRRITHELHDSLAQQVFYLHLGLDQLADDRTVLLSEAARFKAETMRDVAADVYEQVRNNLAILREWEQVDLSEAIGRLGRITAHNAGLLIEFDVQGHANWLSPHTCEDLYGIVREGLNNIVKHAQARHVQLRLAWSSEQLTIELWDDGVGFDPADMPKDRHYGLVLMREVVESLQGTLLLHSTPGQGTNLRVSVPLELTDHSLRKRHSLSYDVPVDGAAL